MTNIEIIGACAGESPYAPEDVAHLLGFPEIGLSYGSDFMGRPGTKIHSCEAHVVKLRSEVRLQEAVARRWCLHALHRERQCAVHHPDKSWFLIRCVGEEHVSIGNICPRLAPLHSLLQAPPASPSEREQWLRWLGSLLEMDCRLRGGQELRLDLGLSNFGLDAEGRLYYLDDDFYSADGFVSLAQTLGVYLRSHGWIDQDFATELGVILKGLLLRYFDDPHCLTMLAEQLRGLFMPNADKRSALDALIQQLAIQRKKAQPAPPADKPVGQRQRYFALLADVHANLPALEAALAFLDKLNIRQGIILGDFVGYGPHPTECIERLQDARQSLALLRGNHDHAAATGMQLQCFSNSARWCIEWTISRLSEAHKAWLLDLPVCLEGEDWLAMHGAPVDPTFFNAYVYDMTYAQNLDVLERRGIPLCFHGHTHMQGVYVRDRQKQDGLVKGEQVALGEFRHCLVCPGSVGQPRNGEGGAQLAVLDWETRQLNFINLSYAVEDTVRDMMEAGFPSSLYHRLRTGL